MEIEEQAEKDKVEMTKADEMNYVTVDKMELNDEIEKNEQIEM